MYINPFVAGILTTVIAEVFLFVGFCIYAVLTTKKK